jgi:hypothetical protein
MIVRCNTDAQETQLVACQPTAKLCAAASGAVNPGGPEMPRRAAPRKECDLNVRWVPTPSPRPIGWRPGRIRNLSAFGLSLLSHERIDPGHVLMVEVQTADQGLPCQLVVETLHAHPTPEGWAVGCVLAAQLRDRHLKQLLG